MTDEEFDSFIARTRDINRLRKAEKIEEEKLKKTASAVATAHNFSSAPCAITGHAFDGHKFQVSLYSEYVHVGEIAKKFGGGGHQGAAGFFCDKLPF